MTEAELVATWDERGEMSPRQVGGKTGRFFFGNIMQNWSCLLKDKWGIYRCSRICYYLVEHMRKYICSMMFYIIVLRSECENENGEIILGFVFIGTC